MRTKTFLIFILFLITNNLKAQVIDTSAVHKTGTETITGPKFITGDITLTGNNLISGKDWQINNASLSDGSIKANFGNTSVYFGSKAGFLFQPQNSNSKIAELVYQPSGLGDGLFLYQSIYGEFDKILTTRDIPISTDGSFSGTDWQINNTNPSNGALKARFGNTSIYYGSKAGFLFQPQNSGGKLAELIYQPSGLGDGLFLYQSMYDAFDRILTNRDITVDNGNVGINTNDTKGYKFAVNGNVVATSVTVKPFTKWPDYVFEKGYHLAPLADVKKYIDKNGHLPGIPCAAEIEDNCQNLGELNLQLTKKVEELTLYLIELKNEVQELKRGSENSKKANTKNIK